MLGICYRMNKIIITFFFQSAIQEPVAFLTAPLTKYIANTVS